jgi:hypothetical protein
VNRLALLATCVAGCSWTTFDDLAKTTPAQAIEKPDNLKASEFAVAIVGVTSGQTGGTFAVLSSGSGNYATIDVAADGSTSLGDNEALGQHTIDSITPNAILVTDGMGQGAIVDNSNVGTVVAIHGPVAGLNVDQQVPTSAHPDAATFAGGRLIIVATSTTGGNAFDVGASGGVTSCILNETATVALSAAAIAAKGTTLYAWSKTGALVSYDLAMLDACPAANPTTPIVGSPVAATTPGPMNGGRIDFDGSFAVLTAYDSAQTMTGQVSVVDVATATMVGTPLAAHGVHSAVIDTFGGMPALVLGYPNRTVTNVANAGAIDIHPIDAAGMVATTPSETISLAQSNSNHVFGRSVTTMKHNNSTIILVDASNTVYAYFKTSLYADTRTP